VIATHFCQNILVVLALAASGGIAAAQTAQQAPLPPQRPQNIAPATPAPAPAPAAVDLSGLPAPTIDRVNAYFNGLRGLKADFVQTSPDGRRFGGTLYLLRPGMMRFEYNPPATLEIVADGNSVAIRDRKLNTQDEYFIGQTPLKFLLQPRIDVAKDSKVTGLRREGADIVLGLEDRSTLGGTSRIRVVFDGRSHALKEWTVTDAQGMNTNVLLSNLDPAVQPDRKLFVINRDRLINPN
jgi:outer membrane lipoprotein-sorting protein